MSLFHLLADDYAFCQGKQEGRTANHLSKTLSLSKQVSVEGLMIPHSDLF